MVVHTDEPLVGGAEDRGIVAAPAVRIGVLDFLETEQRAVVLEDVNDERIAFPDGLSIQGGRQMIFETGGIEEAAGGIDGAVDRQTVLHADDVIFLAVARGGVDGAGALLERDVVGHHAERRAVDERVTVGGAVELIAVEAGDDSRIGRPACTPAALLRGGGEELRRDDIDGVTD